MKKQNKKFQPFKTGDLVIDNKLTNIRSINSVIVSQYRQHYRMGANFPPIVVQAGTNRVVSGNHRLTAMRQEFGDNHQIKVEIRNYATEAEVLEDFARENASHGYRLNGISKHRLYLAMLDEVISIERIAEILDLPVTGLERMYNNMVMVSVGGEPTPKPAKKGFAVPLGETIDEESYNRHMKHDIGVPIINMTTMITNRLTEGTVPISDTLFVALKNLQQAISLFLEKHQKKH